MNYEEAYKKATKGHTKIKKEEKALLADMTPINNEYDKYINRLTTVNKKVNQLTNSTDDRINLLQDSIRMKVLVNHFKKLEAEPDAAKFSITNYLIENVFSIGKWCGAGTRVLENIQNDDDFNFRYAIDNICRNHDIAYTKAKTIEDIHDADKMMLKEIIDNYAINNLFQTKEQMDSLYENIVKHIFSMETLGNILSVMGTYNAFISGASSIVAIPKAIYNFGLEGIKQLPTYRTKLGGELFMNYEMRLDELRVEQSRINSPIMRETYDKWIQKVDKERIEAYNLNEYIPLFKSNIKSLTANIAMKGLFTSAFRDTLVSMFSFGIIASKLIVDMIDENIVDIPLWDTYGFTETYFQESDIEELVKEIENIESQRLASVGYKPIDINNPIFEPIQTIEEPSSNPMEEDTNPMEDELDEITEEEYYLLTQT